MFFFLVNGNTFPWTHSQDNVSCFASILHTHTLAYVLSLSLEIKDKSRVMLGVILKIWNSNRRKIDRRRQHENFKFSQAVNMEMWQYFTHACTHWKTCSIFYLSFKVTLCLLQYDRLRPLSNAFILIYFISIHFNFKLKLVIIFD